MIPEILLYAFTFLQQDTIPVKIHLEIQGLDTNTVSIQPPNENFKNEVVFDKIALIKGGRNFDFSININKSTFLYIKINGEMNMAFAFSPGDTLSLFLSKLKAEKSSYKLDIRGSNEVAHKIYFSKFFPPAKNYLQFSNLTKTEKSYSGYYKKSKIYIDSLTGIWDSLKTIYNNNEVVELYTLDTKSILYNAALRKMAILKRDTTWGSNNKYLSIQNLINYHGKFSDSKLLLTPFGIRGHYEYLSSIIKDDDAIEDEVLKKSDQAYYYYLDPLIREDSWGSEILENKLLFPNSNTIQDSINLVLFAKYYPNSKYLKKINLLQDSLIYERKALKKKVCVDLKEYASLEKSLATLNGDYFFIDTWATWCIPCIQEFNYYVNISKYLIKNNIQEVFWSVDKKSDTEKWKSYINKQFIAGYHFQLSENNQLEILKLLGGKNDILSIPQYLFYNKKKKSFTANLPRPSSGVVLESYINNLLKD